jgi:4-amino-4-deoxy-L-arabinose transferase-like glycosyltransferase
MTIAALTWPDALVHATWIAAGAFIVAVLIWSIFRTGQTAIRGESGQRELVERLRRDVDDLRARLELRE